MRFLKKLASWIKKRAAAKPALRQAAPKPHGQREFRRFMEPTFDHTDEENLRAIATGLQKESCNAEFWANVCSSPVAKRPRLYIGVRPQPNVSQAKA